MEYGIQKAQKIIIDLCYSDFSASTSEKNKSSKLSTRVII